MSYAEHTLEEIRKTYLENDEFESPKIKQEKIKSFLAKRMELTEKAIKRLTDVKRGEEIIEKVKNFTSKKFQ